MTESNQTPGIHFKVSGHFTLSTNKRGKIAEFTNLITNQGLNNLTDSRWYQSAFVGTGSTPPTVNDTDLAVYRAFSNPTNRISTVQGVATSAPYYTYGRSVYRFQIGEATGNLTEIGVGWRNGTVNNLICRTLIKDANGDHTALTILADEILDVTYELRQYIPTEDVTGSITFTGNIGGTYAYTIRPANITTSNISSGGWGGLSGFNDAAGSVYMKTHIGGDLGTIFSAPTGIWIDNLSSVTAAPYQQDSYTCTTTYNCSVTNSNHVNGIRAIKFVLGNGCYQIKFDPPIPKTANDSFSFTAQYSWGRKE